MDGLIIFAIIFGTIAIILLSINYNQKFGNFWLIDIVKYITKKMKVYYDKTHKSD